MKSLIQKGFNVLGNDGLKVFLVRLKNFTIVKLKRLSGKNEFGDWLNLKNKYSGERLFVLGNGPSLNKTPLHLLKGEYTMCFNRINLLFERISWLPDFYVMTDDLLIQDMHQELNSEILDKVGLGFFPDLHPSNVSFKDRIGNRDNVYYLKTDKPEFSKDLPNCGINKTVVNAGLQIGAYLGFKEIYLLGVDMTFADRSVKKENSRDWEAKDDDDINHFDPRYFGKGRKYHNPTVHEMMEQFKKGKQFFEGLGVNVYNAGIGGKLQVFERVDFTRLFDVTPEQELNKLLSGIEGINVKGTLKETFPNALLVESDKDWDDSKRELICNSEIGLRNISGKIHDFIPLGPYQNKYVFLSRKFYSGTNDNTVLSKDQA